MRTHVVLFLLLAPVLLTGCVSPAEKLDPRVVRQVKEGMSRPDVEKVMGKPGSLVTGAGEHKVAHYSYSARLDSAEYQLLGAFAKNPGDILARHLSVLYNGQNTAEKVLFSQSLTPFDVGFGRVSAGQTISPETLAQVKKGISTQDEMIKLFGEPTVRALEPDGNVGMVWRYGKYKMGWTKNQSDFQRLWIIFDQEGRVKEHTLSGNVEPQ